MKLKKFSKKGDSMMIIVSITIVILLIIAYIVWSGGLDLCKISQGIAC